MKEAHDQSILPPTIVVPCLGSQSVSNNEIMQILNIQHLVQCIEHIFLHPSHADISFSCQYLKDREMQGPLSVQQLTQLSPTWRFDLYAAYYTLFLAAAVVARHFQEPFHSQMPGKPDYFLQNYESLHSEMAYRDPVANWISRSLTSEEVDYICKFDAYRFNDTEKQENVFGNFAQWFINDIKAQNTGESSRESTMSIRGLRRILQCLHAYEEFFGPFQGNKDHWRRHGFYRSKRTELKYSMKGPIRKANIVCFGDFQIHEVTMPADLELSHQQEFLPRLRALENKAGPNIPDGRVILRKVYGNSSLPNTRIHPIKGWALRPRPPLQLFEFITRKYFGKEFIGELFNEANGCDRLWREFQGNGYIYGNSDVWAGASFLLEDL